MAMEIAAPGGLLELIRIRRRLERRAEFNQPLGDQLASDALAKMYRDRSSHVRSEVPSSKDQQKMMTGLVDEVSLLVASYGKELTQASPYERNLYGGHVSDSELADHFFLTFSANGEAVVLVSNSDLFSLDPLAAKLVYTNYTQEREVEFTFDHDDSFRLNIDFLKHEPTKAAHVYSTGMNLVPLEKMTREEFVIANDFLGASKKKLQPLRNLG